MKPVVSVSGPIEGRYCVRELEANVTNCSWFDTAQDACDFVTTAHPATTITWDIRPR